MDTIKTIRTNFLACIQNTLGVEWLKLENPYNLENNNFYNSTKRFYCGFEGGESAPGQIMKYLSVRRSLRVVLTNGFIGTLNNYGSIENSINVLENAMEDILKIGIKTKLDTPQYVLNTGLTGIEMPDFTSIENLMIYQFILFVDYRAQVVEC